MEDFIEQAAMDLVRRFVRASGSLRELAESLGVARADGEVRLDPLVGRLRESDGGGAFERALVGKYLRGAIDRATLRELLVAHAEVARGQGASSS